MELAEALRADPEKPTFHLLPGKGWMNDPNGLFWHKGRYHMCALCPGPEPTTGTLSPASKAAPLLTAWHVDTRAACCSWVGDTAGWQIRRVFRQPQARCRVWRTVRRCGEVGC